MGVFRFTKKQEKKGVWVQEMIEFPTAVWNVLGKGPYFPYVQVQEVNGRKALYTIPSEAYSQFREDMKKWDFTHGQMLRELLISLSESVVRLQAEVRQLRRDIAKLKGEEG